MIRVLVVDDHDMVRAGLRTILESDGDFEVVGERATADNIETVVGQNRVDVVLLDARLPGMSGADACRRITTSHPGVKVIMVSTYTDDNLVDECIEAGAHGYVVKDIDRFNLKQSIRAVYRGEAMVSPAVAGRILERARSRTQAKTQDRAPLNESQRTILRLISEGFSNREIAAHVHLSENTVKSHIQEIFRKLEVRNRVQAALKAVRAGWV